MAGVPGHPGNVHAVGQVRAYVEGLAAKERREVERLSGVACDGHWMVFCRYRAGRWIVDDPVPVDTVGAERLMEVLLAAQSGRALTAENLLRDFSAEAPLTRQLTGALLTQLDAETGQRPDGLASKLFRQWEALFAVATGVTGEGKELDRKGTKALADVLGTTRAGDPSKTLFCLQTYFSIVTKLIASLSLAFFVEDAEWDLNNVAEGKDDELLADLESLQHGMPFVNAGLLNVLEPDVFGWYLNDPPRQVVDAVRLVIEHLKEYEPATLHVSPEDTRDLLKDLYQGLLPRPLRHSLGQYFTPDWLAGMLLDRLGYHGEAEVRLLDPACGTGTFLVLAVGRLIENLRRRKVPDEDILDATLKNIVGFDIDPLAALAARTNFVLALGPLIRLARGRSLDLPVYRADSMIGPTLKALAVGDRLVLDTVAGQFALPPCVDTGAELRAVCDLASQGLQDDMDIDEFGRLSGDACQATDSERAILRDFYAACQEINQQGVDGLWPRLLRNAFMPAFIGRFDLCAGNPPWVNWEHLPAAYRERSRSAWNDSGLFVHGGMSAMLGAGKKDVSMLMSYVVTDRLLEPHGRLGFVVPETLFKTAGAGQGFRTFRVGQNGPSLRVEAVDDMVDLKPFAGAANRTALLVWERDAKTTYPVPYRQWQRIAHRGIPEDATVEDVVDQTRRLDLAAAPVSSSDPTSAWLAAPPDLVPALRKIAATGDPPAYQAHAGVYAGANGVYWISVDGDSEGGTVPISNLHDIGDLSVPKRFGRAETELVHPLIRGSDIKRWHVAPSASILFVQDANRRKGIDEATMESRYPEALRFLSQFEDILTARRGLRTILTPDETTGQLAAPFWSMFGVGPYTLAKHKVVWKDQAADFAAAVLEGPDRQSLPLPNHKVMLVECGSSTEALYLCGVLNSTPVRVFVASYAVQTAIATHVVKYIRVPKFDTRSKSHAAVVKVSKDAHKAVAAGRAANQAAVDDAVARLWKLNSKETGAMQFFLDRLLKRDLPSTTRGVAMPDRASRV